MTQSTDAPQSVYYGHRFPDDLEALEAGCMPMDRVAPYPPEFMALPGSMVRSCVDACRDAGMNTDQILARFSPDLRPITARYLVQQGEALRSEFRSEEEAKAFWAHVGEDDRTERSNLGEHGMAQVPDPGE